MDDKSEYRSDNGIAAWWSKDGLWHIALPYTPTESDRQNYPVSYPAGSDGPFFRWSPRGYQTRDDAIAAIENI